MQELILIHAELSARVGRSVLNSAESADCKSAFIHSADSVLDSQIVRGSDPESAEKSVNHQEFRVFTLRIHSVDRGESMQELILIRAELSARAGRSVLSGYAW